MKEEILRLDYNPYFCASLLNSLQSSLRNSLYTSLGKLLKNTLRDSLASSLYISIIYHFQDPLKKINTYEKYI